MQVQVRSPARLHLGFLDMNGALGYRFGSLGLGIQEIGVDFKAERAAEISAEGPGADRALRFAHRLLAGTGLGVRMTLNAVIPGHSGLGSGTQLALAVATALARLYGWPWSTEELAWRLGRGRRSGIGIHAFRAGGFVVDGGRGAGARPPQLIARLTVPDTWRFVLVMDPVLSGISGAGEREAFARLGRMPDAAAAELCRVALMQVLPALAESNCDGFGAGITRIQSILGAYFSPAQRGPYTSRAVAGALELLSAGGAAGIGQSSWGPTGFAIFDSETRAHQAVRRARAGHDTSKLDFVICRAQNRPALVREMAAAARARRR